MRTTTPVRSVQHDELEKFLHHQQVEYRSLSISKLKLHIMHIDLFLNHEYNVNYQFM